MQDYISNTFKNDVLAFPAEALKKKENILVGGLLINSTVATQNTICAQNCIKTSQFYNDTFVLL